MVARCCCFPVDITLTEMADPPPPLAPAPTLIRAPSHPLEINSDNDDIDEVLMVGPPPPLTRPAHHRYAGPTPATSPTPSSPIMPPPHPFPIPQAQPLLSWRYPCFFVSPSQTKPHLIRGACTFQEPKHELIQPGHASRAAQC
jgi:hypothetical protein